MANMAQIQMLLFSITFHSIADILFLVLSVLSASVVSKSPWRIHLRWLVPLIADDALTLLYRVTLNVHYFQGTRWGNGEYTLSQMFLYMADAVGLYAMYTLWRTLAAIIPRPGLGEPASPVHESEVWPPPPAGAA